MPTRNHHRETRNVNRRETRRFVRSAKASWLYS